MPASHLPLLLLALPLLCGAQSLDPVVVSAPAGPKQAWGAPFAVSVVEAETLQRAGALIQLSEALQRVPGLVVANRQNFAQDLQISSRGFGARAGFGVRGLRLVTDGIPAGGPDGQGQVSHFDLAGAAHVEVLRGPFSALYGNASGGVIALVSRAPTEARTQLALDLGSDALRQWRLRVDRPLDEGWS
ncbi:MAG: TonB-dependent receptor plug domain-containing protein, partial [Burkholderiales bacterium]|nr:TonB-dependent receptor plug domain-containing protein [Burkholderiales bacterium]